MNQRVKHFKSKINICAHVLMWSSFTFEKKPDEYVHVIVQIYKIFLCFQFNSNVYFIREIPDHATFREKVQRLGWLDKLWVFSLWTYVIMPTLTTCSFQSILVFKNVNMNNKYMEYSPSHDVTQLGT